MTELIEGQRVRVTYEAILGRRADDGVHYVTFKDAVGDYRTGPVPDTGITVIADADPQPAEPEAFGSLVEVDGTRYTRTDDDCEPWRGDYEQGGYYSWEDITRRGPVKVLFDPDAAEVKANPDALPATVVDGERDTWYLKANGKYRLYMSADYEGTTPLEEIRQKYGIFGE